MKQTIKFAGLVLAVAFSLASCGGNQNNRRNSYVSEETTQVEEDYSSQTIEQVENDEPSFVDYVGQYEFTDIADQTFVLTLNEDETCQLRQKGADYVYYGSYHDYLSSSKYIELHFSETPRIIFPSFDETGGWKIMGILFSADFIYYSNTACAAKDPKKRLELKRIN